MIYNRPEYWMRQNIDPFLTFISDESFSLKVGKTKNWNGTIEYSTDCDTWSEWTGSSIQSASGNDGYVLYLRGTGNTVISGNNQDYRFVITGTDVRCKGSIETLLDYETAATGAHPIMESGCFRLLFYANSALTEAPSLPATT